MKTKTSELIGPALDWVVAKCEGHYVFVSDGEGEILGFSEMRIPMPKYSTDWDEGGPVIEVVGISILCFEGLWYAFANLPTHDCIRDIAEGYVGETPLIAAMRCYVQSMLGDEVDVPEELL